MLVIGIARHRTHRAGRDWLQHDAVAGVILEHLPATPRARRSPSSRRRSAPPRRARSWSAWCKEGGRVQRFRDGYSDCRRWRCSASTTRRTRRPRCNWPNSTTWLMASEIIASGVDLSFAPVVGLARGNRAIGNRAFDADPQIVAEFTRAYVRGMHSAGMAATLKHFPGHGTVLEDTHFDDAVDPRPLDVLRAEECRSRSSAASRPRPTR